MPRSHRIKIKILKDLYTHVPEKNVMFILCGFLFGLFIFIPVENALQFSILKAVQIILFFFLGSVYLASLKTIANKPGDGNSYVIFIAAVIALMLSAVYLQTKRTNWFFAVSSCTAFVLPGCIGICWKYFQLIMKKNYNNIQQRRSSILTPGTSESIFLNIKVQTKDDASNGYTTEVLCNTKLKDFFSTFLNNLNKDTSLNNYINTWEFFVLNLEELQLRKLDADLTFYENKIEQYSTLVIKPLKHESIPVNPKLSAHEHSKQ